MVLITKQSVVILRLLFLHFRFGDKSVRFIVVYLELGVGSRPEDAWVFVDKVALNRQSFQNQIFTLFFVTGCIDI